MNMSKSRDIQSQNAITEGDGILARNCEGTEQLRFDSKIYLTEQKK